MSHALTQLPKDDKVLAEVMRMHSARCYSHYAWRRVNWLLAYYYLSGYRTFDLVDTHSGRISARHVAADGNVEYRSEELVYVINQLASRLQAMDMRPSVVAQGTSLGAIRDRSVLQIVADSLFLQDDLDRNVRDFAWLFSCLGSAGVTCEVEDHPAMGLTAELEIIHPKELMPWPLLGEDPTKLSGIMRERVISMDHLYTVFGKKVIDAKKDKDLEWFLLEHGQALPAVDMHYSANTMGMGNAHLSENVPHDQGAAFCKVRELWTFGPGRTVADYVISSGTCVLSRQDLRTKQVHCPVGFARFMDNGTFHGAGLFDVMFHSHRQLEKLSKRLFQNVHDTERFGLLVLPQGQIPQESALKPVGDSLKVLFYEPDAISEGFKPFAITPVNTGEIPGRTAAFAREAMERTNPIRDLIDNKGRVDSASGLSFLQEQINQALTNPSGGLRDAFSAMYKAAASRGLLLYTTTKRPVTVHNLSLDMAGAIINQKDGTLSFSDNPLPDISRLQITLRALTPRSPAAVKAELYELWRNGIEQDPMSFRLAVIRAGIEVPLWMEEEKGAYEMAVLSILTLFGNGEEPGELILTPSTTRPDIVARVLAGFMCSPVMQKASPPVIDAFSAFRQTLMSYMGPMLPMNMPNPDQLAMLSQGAGTSQAPQPNRSPAQ